MELREFREALGETLQCVADETDIDKGTLSRIENKARRPSPWHIQTLNAWAERKRKSRKWPVSSRVDWSWAYERRAGGASAR